MASATEKLNFKFHFNLNNHTWLVATVADSEGMGVGGHSSLPLRAPRGTGGAPEAARPQGAPTQGLSTFPPRLT